MSLDEECLGWIETIYSYFVHEFFRASNKDSGCEPFAAFDLSKAMQDGELFLQDWAAIGNGGGRKGEFERKVEIGGLFSRNLVQVSREWAGMEQ